jgi:hypothetical protein
MKQVSLDDNRGADSQSAAPRLVSALCGRAKRRVETSLDPAGKSACATGSPDLRHGAGVV